MKLLTMNFPGSETMSEDFQRMCALRQAGGIARYHTEPWMPPQRVDSHSWGVAVLALELFPEDIVLCKACLYHDTGEVGPGDIPAPAKWMFPALAEASNHAEFDTRMMLKTEIHLTTPQQKRLKFLDRLELAWFCVEQRLCGNLFASAIFRKVRESINNALLEQDGFLTKDNKASVLWMSLCKIMDYLDTGRVQLSKSGESQ